MGEVDIDSEVGTYGTYLWKRTQDIPVETKPCETRHFDLTPPNASVPMALASGLVRSIRFKDSFDLRETANQNIQFVQLPPPHVSLSLASVGCRIFARRGVEVGQYEDFLCRLSPCPVAR
jgi:hypothetical protein